MRRWTSRSRDTTKREGAPSTMSCCGARLIRGRFISPQDDERGRRVAVIDRHMAQRFWPGQDAIGKRFRSTDRNNVWLEVVGVEMNRPLMRRAPQQLIVE